MNANLAWATAVRKLGGKIEPSGWASFTIKDGHKQAVVRVCRAEEPGEPVFQIIHIGHNEGFAGSDRDAYQWVRDKIKGALHVK